MAIRIRHHEAPTPQACRRCGREKRSHGMSFVASVGYHLWDQPTDAQVKARMLARRAARLQAVGA